MSDAPLRIGVAGLGVGLRVHLPILQLMPNVEVVAIAGTDKKRAEALAAAQHVSIGCGSLEDFFQQDLDAVIVALPPRVNEIAVQMALERNLPVLAEKPLASSGKRARQLSQLAVSQITMMDFYFSDIAAFKTLKRLIETRTYGAVRHVQVSWLVESFVQQNRTWSWKTDANQCGGVVSMLGSHLLYLIEWLFGSIQGLCASMSSRVTTAFTPASEESAPDLMSLLVDLPAGIQLSATVSNVSPGGTGHRWEVVFEEGTAILYNPRSDYHVGFGLTMRTRSGEERLIAYDPVPLTDERSPFRILLQRFVDAIRTHTPTSPDFTVGARVQDLMDAVYRAARERKFMDTRF